MDKAELRTLVSQLLQEMHASDPVEPNQETALENLEDLAELDLRSAYRVESPENQEAFLRLKQRTPARLGLGRCGARYRTQSMLRFRADHAAARDSVFSLVAPRVYEENHWTFVQTMCQDKDQYLTRPDLGRRFDETNQQVIRQTCGTDAKVLLVVGDGLSSNAITANGADCARAIEEGLKTYGISIGNILFIQYARVGAMDHIGALTGAELICMLVGERPGLVTSESMSAYLTYQPRPGIAESKRTVVSNIHRQGTPAVEAGAHIAELMVRMLEQKASGVDLRQRDDR